MKLDKRIILASALVLGLGLGFQACSSDDEADDGTCTVNADCKDEAKPVCDAGRCVAQATPETDKCEGKKAGDECDTGKTCQAGDDGKLSCKDNAAGPDPSDKVECYMSSQCKDDAKVCIGNKCVAKSGATTCEKKADCEDGMWCENGTCVSETGIPSTCGNAVVDELEVCDRKAGSDIAVLPEGETKGCMLFVEADPQNYPDPSKVTIADGGEVGCAKNCLGYAKGTCEITVEGVVCGDKEVTGNEKCDVNADGKTVVIDATSNEVRVATCTDHNSTDFAANGQGSSWWGEPKCNDKCSGIQKGTCSTTKPADSVNGIVSCKVTSLEKVTEEGENKNKVKGVVEVVAASESATVKGAVLCSSTATDKFGALIGKAGDSTAEIAQGVVTAYTNALTAGSYNCVVVVQDFAAKDKLNTASVVVCSESGAVIGGGTLGGTDISKVTGVKVIEIQ